MNSLNNNLNKSIESFSVQIHPVNTNSSTNSQKNLAKIPEEIKYKSHFLKGNLANSLDLKKKNVNKSYPNSGIPFDFEKLPATLIATIFHYVGESKLNTLAKTCKLFNVIVSKLVTDYSEIFKPSPSLLMKYFEGAIKAGNEIVVKDFLNKVDPKNSSYRLLQLASHHTNKNIVSILLNDERVNLRDIQYSLITQRLLLNWAVAYNDIDFLKKLFNENHVGIFHYGQLVDSAIKCKQIGAIRFLFEYDQNIFTSNDPKFILKLLNMICSFNDQDLFNKIISKITLETWKDWVDNCFTEKWNINENPFICAASCGNIDMFKEMGKQVEKCKAKKHIKRFIIDNCLKIGLINNHIEFANFICSTFSKTSTIFGKNIRGPIKFNSSFETACKQGHLSILENLLKNSIGLPHEVISNELYSALKAENHEIVKLIYTICFVLLTQDDVAKVKAYLIERNINVNIPLWKRFFNICNF
jgi:hypothetical protein